MLIAFSVLEEALLFHTSWESLAGSHYTLVNFPYVSQKVSSIFCGSCHMSIRARMNGWTITSYCKSTSSVSQTDCTCPLNQELLLTWILPLQY